MESLPSIWPPRARSGGNRRAGHHCAHSRHAAPGVARRPLRVSLVCYNTVAELDSLPPPCHEHPPVRASAELRVLVPHVCSALLRHGGHRMLGHCRDGKGSDSRPGSPARRSHLRHTDPDRLKTHAGRRTPPVRSTDGGTAEDMGGRHIEQDLERGSPGQPSIFFATRRAVVGHRM